MLYSIGIAFVNGLVVGVSRSVNGRLSSQIGALKASLSNHLVGFIFLTLILLGQDGWKFEALREVSLFAYLGGLFGALFVAFSSYVFPRLGAINAALLVISGQMITAVLIDWSKRGVGPSFTQVLGVLMVLVGIYLTRIRRHYES